MGFPRLNPRLMKNRIFCQILALGLLCGLGAVCGQESTPALIAAKKTSPAEFLDALGKTAKARWRLYFRPPPPTPPVDRAKAALILGSLVAESHLIWQATDSQQFRNNNQDLVTYCRMIGVGDGIMPRLMAQGKMAEMEQWKELRTEISLTQDEMSRLLHEMQDDDLSHLIDTGLWLRVLEVCNSIAAEAPTEIAPDLRLTTQSATNELREHLSAVSANLSDCKYLQQLRNILDALPKDPKANESIQTMMQSLLDKEK